MSRTLLGMLGKTMCCRKKKKRERTVKNALFFRTMYTTFLSMNAVITVYI